MTVSGLTAVTFVLILYGFRSRLTSLRAIALAGVPAAGVAITLGGIGIPVIYAVALPILIREFVERRGRRAEGDPPALPPGILLLVIFFGWCATITLIAPFLFNGQPVVSPSTPPLAAGAVTKSNIAQLLYLAAGICLAVFVARSKAARPQLLAITIGLVMALSLWRYVASISGLPFPEGLFDNSPTFVFIDTAPGGAERFRGILSEPSSLGGSCLVALAYMIPRGLETSGRRQIGSFAIAAAALFLGILSTSTTFIIAGLASVGLISLASLVGFLRRRYSVTGVLAAVLMMSFVVLAWFSPVIFSSIQQILREKASSSSFEERSSGNSQAFALFLDTWGLGAGLGSSRASSFVPSLLGGVGLPGALLLTAAVVTFVWQARGKPGYRTVRWVLLVSFVTKVVAGPDLGDITGAFWISFGLLAGIDARSDSTDDVRVTLSEPSPPPAGDRARRTDETATADDSRITQRRQGLR